MVPSASKEEELVPSARAHGSRGDDQPVFGPASHCVGGTRQIQQVTVPHDAVVFPPVVQTAPSRDRRSESNTVPPWANTVSLRNCPGTFSAVGRGPLGAPKYTSLPEQLTAVTCSRVAAEAFRTNPLWVLVTTTV